MITRLLLPFIGLLLFPFLIRSQIAEYNYQDYRQATTRLQQLNFTPSLLGLHRKIDDSFVSEYDRTNEGRMALNFNYLDLQNSPDQQNRLDASFGVAPSYFSGSGDSVSVSAFGLDQGSSLDWIRDNYNEYNTWFVGWEVAFNQSARFDGRTMEDQVETDEKETTIFGYISPKFRFGYGRLENITGAWHAYRLLQRFNYLEIAGDFDIDEINGFGNFIDELRAMRVFDARLNYIAQLKLLDSYLSYDLGLDPVQSIAYFVELNDMWRYGISENRVKGRKLTFSIGPANRWFWRKEDENGSSGDYGYTNIGATFQADYFVGQPLKADKQLNWGGGIASEYYSFYNINDGKFDRNYDQLTVQPYAQIMWGYYPTTRTDYELFANVGYSFVDRDYAGITDDSTDDGMGTNLSGQMRYWFSPRTRILVSLSFNYGRVLIDPSFVRELEVDSNWRAYYAVRLIHALF